MGELFLNERGPAVVLLGMQMPVALDGRELARPVPDGFDGDEDGGFPNVLGPCDAPGQAARQHEPSADLQRVVAEFGKQIVKKSFCGQIRGKRRGKRGGTSRNVGGGG